MRRWCEKTQIDIDIDKSGGANVSLAGMLAYAIIHVVLHMCVQICYQYVQPPVFVHRKPDVMTDR